MLLTVPLTLENAWVRLEPLDAGHAPELAEAAQGLEHAWYTSVPTPEGVPDEIDRRLTWQSEGHMNAWAIRRLDTGRLAGMTTFCNIDQANRHVEIGHTWISPTAQRTSRTHG